MHLACIMSSKSKHSWWSIMENLNLKNNFKQRQADAVVKLSVPCHLFPRIYQLSRHFPQWVPREKRPPPFFPWHLFVWRDIYGHQPKLRCQITRPLSIVFRASTRWHLLANAPGFPSKSAYPWIRRAFPHGESEFTPTSQSSGCPRWPSIFAFPMFVVLSFECGGAELKYCANYEYIGTSRNPTWF